MKAIEQYVYVVLFIMLCKVVLTFKSVEKTLVCDHRNDRSRAVLSCGTVHYAIRSGCNFLHKVFLTFKFVDKTLECDH